MTATTILDGLAQMAEREAVSGNRATFSPRLELSGELLDCVRLLGWLDAAAPPVARLWSLFDGANGCAGFDLRPGAEGGARGPLLWCARRDASGVWDEGPRIPNFERKPKAVRERFAIHRRIIELTPARLSDFASHHAEQTVRGATLSGACARCGRPLTDAISLERGIGPECWKKDDVPFALVAHEKEA